MSIQLKLDAAAVASLFPEGSTIRLELQQAVINETVRKIVDRELTKTRAHIENQCRITVEQALLTEGLTSKTWQGVTLADSYKAKLKDQAIEAANTACSAAIGAAMTPLLAMINDRMEKMTDAAFRSRMEGLAKEALRGALK